MTAQRDIIIAADFGTSGVKVGLMGRDLAVRADVFREYPVHHLDNGGAEQEPIDWWNGFRAALEALRRKHGSEMKRAAALVYSAQMCGVTPVDAEGVPLRRAMIWLDKRSADLIRNKMGGFPAIAGYGARRLAASVWLTNGAPSLNGMDPPGKMMWLKQNEPDVWQRTHKFLDAKDWLIHRSTGKFVTTADCANLTWMMNSRGGGASWSPYLVKLFGMRLDQLPDIVPGTSSPGGLTAQAARELGLEQGLPVVAGAGDVAAAALGSGAIEDGALHMCLGTSSWIGGFYAGRRLSARESYATITSSIDNRPLLIATQESAGACIDWFEGVSTPGNESPAHAEEVPPPLFLPWMAGERVPVDDNKLRGAFIGLTFRHARQSLANAVVEGIGLNTRWAYQSVARQRGTMRNQPMPLVGGAADNAELCQTLADCLNVDLIVGPAPRTAGMQGTGAIASAFLGWHGNAWAAACCLSRPAARVYTPDRERHRYFDQRFELFLKAFQQLKPWMREAHQGAAMP